MPALNLSGVTLHFAPEKPLPAPLVRKIVKARLEEMSSGALLNKRQKKENP